MTKTVGVGQRSEAKKATVGSKKNLSRAQTLGIQFGIVVLFILFWEFAPQIPALRAAIPIFDPYFISSPTAIVKHMGALAVGDNTVLVWPYFFATLEASVLGIIIGSISGALAGLILSNSPTLNLIARPFLVAFNAVPRVALIPIIVLIVGPNQSASIITAVLIVFFIVFFNAFEGGRSVPIEVIQNAQLLGANKRDILFTIRARYVAGWTFAALPNAVSFGFVSVVTAEILTGTTGMGRLLADSVYTIQPSLTFSVVVILSLIGLLFTIGVEIANRRIMHWWSQGGVANR